jgi:hypothetical protein
MPTITVEARSESEARGIIAQQNFLSLLLVASGIAAALAFLAMLFLIAAAGLRGAWLLAKAFPLYPAALLASFILFAIIVRAWRISKILSIPLALAAAGTAAWFGCTFATTHYGNSARVFPSMYCADYILPKTGATAGDATPFILYEKRNQKGAKLAELAADEKVIVNGISFDRREFNITTIAAAGAAAKTGWVTRDAFPADAADMLGITLGLDGMEGGEIAVDRQTGRLFAKYLEPVRQLQRGDEKATYYKMSKDTLDRATKVGVTTPLLRLDLKQYKDGAAALAPAGAGLALTHILYAEDCTLIRLAVTDPAEKGARIWSLPGGINAAAWKKSLATRDLGAGAGETWPLLAGDYVRSFYYEKTKNGCATEITLFFPPFKSRHFSLTHGGVTPLPPREKTGYGGIMGFMAGKLGAGGDGAYYMDYNFPEVRVK